MTPDALLARVTDELEFISREQHALERRRHVLRDAATRLRTGESVGLVEARLREHESVEASR